MRGWEGRGGEQTHVRGWEGRGGKLIYTHERVVGGTGAI